MHALSLGLDRDRRHARWASLDDTATIARPTPRPVVVADMDIDAREKIAEPAERVRDVRADAVVGPLGMRNTLEADSDVHADLLVNAARPRIGVPGRPTTHSNTRFVRGAHESSEPRRIFDFQESLKLELVESRVTDAAHH